MSDVLIFGDTLCSSELRREVPLTIPDPFLYAEVEGTRHVVIPQLEIPRLDTLGLELETHSFDEMGSDELYRQGLDSDAVRDRVAVRFCQQYGVQQAIVPDTFPVRTADALRAAGIDLTPHQELFSDRRRAKTPSQLAGIKRAQRAAAAGMAAVTDLIRRAEPHGEGVVVDGDPLTSERLHRTLLRTFLENDATADEVIASHGPQAARGHDMGAGPIRPGEPIIVDVWPRDTASACYTDMSRTFVIGEPPGELAEYQRVVKEALDAAVAEMRPGVAGHAVYDASCDVIEAGGCSTMRTKEPGTALDHGFYHGLGHGVGLEVHEAPLMGITTKHELVAGDVVTVEPGIYRPEFGGCRLEDIVLVTEDGAELLTTFPYELTP